MPASVYPLLDAIYFPADLKRFTLAQLCALAQEMRQYLLSSLNLSGGHFSANLGAVELAIALHVVFDAPQDRLVWDVGHQAYPHKLLTGRRVALPQIRQAQGLAPFPAREESEYDAFGVGHAGTSISAALGMALAGRSHCVAVIGDGAMTAGQAYEALRHAGQLQADVGVVLNDNAMSISHHDVVFSAPFFEALQLHYEGPVDGHDLPTLITRLQHWKKKKGPKVLHVRTQKGKGYAPAEQDPVHYHAVAPGYLTSTIKPQTALTYSHLFGEWVCQMAAQDTRLVAITPAMCEGSGLVSFRQRYPQRFFDVGIAEQHSVTLAAGMACEGMQPVVAIYSTFLQRAYDQVIHDVALQQLPVLFAIDRAGMVGGDGATHQGVFDLSYLRCIPNMVIMTPSDEQTCWAMLTTGFLHAGPAAVRYPRGSCDGSGVVVRCLHPLPLGQAAIKRQGEKIVLLAFGSVLAESLIAAEALNATVVDMRFVKPLDEALIATLVKTHEMVVTLEENVVAGGAGSAVSEYLARIHCGLPQLMIGLPDQFIFHGDPALQREQYHLTAPGIEKLILNFKRSLS